LDLDLVLDEGEKELKFGEVKSLTTTRRSVRSIEEVTAISPADAGQIAVANIRHDSGV
tara:strand:- start:538 stop:711 length:174 start_codon:yes stop_codon:yes gene_type:complete